MPKYKIGENANPCMSSCPPSMWLPYPKTRVILSHFLLYSCPYARSPMCFHSCCRVQSLLFRAKTEIFRYCLDQPVLSCLLDQTQSCHPLRRLVLISRRSAWLPFVVVPFGLLIFLQRVDNGFYSEGHITGVWRLARLSSCCISARKSQARETKRPAYVGPLTAALANEYMEIAHERVGRVTPFGLGASPSSPIPQICTGWRSGNSTTSFSVPPIPSI